MDLPPGMDTAALQGLARLVRTDPTGYVDQLKAYSVEARLAFLRQLSPIKAPGRLLTPPLEAKLKKFTANIRPGLDLFQGTPSQAVAEVENRVNAVGSRFSDATVRKDFEEMIMRFRGLVEKLENGEKVEPNVVGLFREINATLLELELGTEVWKVGPQVDGSHQSNPSLDRIECTVHWRKKRHSTAARHWGEAPRRRPSALDRDDNVINIAA
jgi:hypothetical protein